MSRQPERHFSTVWYVSMANVGLLTLPLGLLGWVDGWATFCGYYSVFAFGFFLGPEWAAGGVKRGHTGTKTSWLFARVPETWVRVLIGFWMGALMLWRFPDGWVLDAVAWGFLLWLPPHYYRKGMRGPVDWLARWLGRITGLDRII